MADVQIAVIDQQNTEVTIAVPGVQGPVGQTGDVTVAQDGTAAQPGIRFENDTNTGIYSPGADQVAVSTGGTGRLFVDSSGSVGIGISSPAAALDVNGSINFADSSIVGSTKVNISTDTTQAYYFGLARLNDLVRFNGMKVYNNANGSGGSPASRIGFFTDITGNTASTERLTITETGRVGIGATSPAGPCEIYYGGNDSGLYITSDDDASWGYSPNIFFRTELTNGGGVGTSGRIQSVYESYNYYGMSFYTTSAGSNAEVARLDASGRLLVGATAHSGDALLQVNGDRIRVATAKTPASAAATGTAGEICWDASYIYVCTATNTWKRTAISTW